MEVSRPLYTTSVEDRKWFNALKEGKLRTVKHLHENSGTNVNTCNKYGVSSLVQAIRCSTEHRNRYKVIKYLVKSNADINIKNDGDRPLPLNEAVIFNDIKTVKLLLKKGADIDSLDDRGMAPLHHAAERGFFEIAEELLKYDAYIDNISMWGWGSTPLDFTSQNRDVRLNNLLITEDAKSADEVRKKKNYTLNTEETIPADVVQHIRLPKKIKKSKKKYSDDTSSTL